MKFLFIILALSLVNVSLAQNIVPNPSFEEDTSCPNAFNEIYFCDSWGTGNEGTPDYYSACDTNSISSTSFAVPDNWVGAQAAFSGHAYAGIYGYSEVEGPDYHEYLMVSAPAMEPGVAYHVSMQVSLADSSGYASNGLGMFFNTYGSFAGTTTIRVAPQVDFNSFGVITNNTGWTRLTGTFTPDSAFTRILIGVFKDSGQIFKVPIKNPPFFEGFTYYYIDSVIVEKVSDAAPQFAAASALSIFPNPLYTGTALLTFENPLGLAHSLILLNMEGQEVRSWTNITTGEIKIDHSGLLPGMYYYQLKGPGNIETGKLVVGQ